MSSATTRQRADIAIGRQRSAHSIVITWLGLGLGVGVGLGLGLVLELGLGHRDHLRVRLPRAAREAEHHHVMRGVHAHAHQVCDLVRLPLHVAQHHLRPPPARGGVGGRGGGGKGRGVPTSGPEPGPDHNHAPVIDLLQSG